MSIFQIVAVLFALLMLYLVRIHGRKRVIGFLEMLWWSLMWISFAVMALFPELMEGVVQKIHFARVFDLLTVLSLMILSTVIFLSYFRLRQIQKVLEKIIRKDALSKFLKKR